jgi:STE24 endopeptidase
MNLIFYLIVGILLLDFLFERVLSWLNIKNISYTLPDVSERLYDEEKYATQQKYFFTNQRFALITALFGFLTMFLFFILGGFGWLDAYVRTFVENTVLVSLLFFAILFLLNDILSTPFDIYDTFVIEERFGFNKTTKKTYLSDKIKGYLLTAVIGGGLLSLIMFIYEWQPTYFWIMAWAVLAFFSIFLNMFYSDLIVPLFNKQTPLENGELRDEIEQFSKKAGFNLDNIFVIDGSKRSTKANAYFSGLGAKKRVVLYDTLIQELTKEEIVAVLAHEIGHYKKKHTLMALFFSLVNMLIMFYILSLFLNNHALSLAKAMGSETSSFHLSILSFGLLYTPISMVLSIGMNIISRKNEYQADAYAAGFGLGEHLISGLKKLSVKSLSNLQPHPAYVFVHYSHPTLLQRMKKIFQ